MKHTHSDSDNATDLCVVQVSDCHLGREPGERLLGMDTDHSLDEVLKLVRHNHSHIDLLVMSGDLSADGDASAYQRLLPKLEGLAAQTVWLPGNHDDVPTMQRCVDTAQMPSQITLGDWQFRFLNSAVPDEVGGHLADSELNAVKSLNSEQPAMIFLHHHLRPLGAAWLDEQRVDNADDLFALLDEQPSVAAVVSGHVHQQSDTRHGNQRLLTTPSTCIQFAPGSHDFALDDLNPGYRWFNLSANGDWQTGVERVSGVTFTVDRTANGYA